jgi:hypothetical protein
MAQLGGHPWKGPVHKVWHTLLRGGLNAGHFVSDLLLTDHGPFLVLEWEDRPDGSYPVVAVRLDPAALHPVLIEDASHLYEHPVEDPRPLH